MTPKKEIDTESLDKRIIKAEESFRKKKKIPNSVKTKQYSKGINLIIQLTGTILIFSLLGYFIDLYFDILPIFLLIFLAIGFFISIYNIWRDTNKNLGQIEND